MGPLKTLESLPVQNRKLPVMFSCHGSPFQIIRSREEYPLWQALYDVGRDLEREYEIKAVLVVSAHWLSEGTYINTSQDQEQIFDYRGFPEEFYQFSYKAQGAPKIASDIQELIPGVKATADWGLDHGTWPVLMHLFPEANVPVFQMSVFYDADPEYHYKLGKQLRTLRERGVLIIGSGALIHNTSGKSPKPRVGKSSGTGEDEYDRWLVKQIDERNISNLINYQTSHEFGLFAAPTPDHFVPVLYCLGAMDEDEKIEYFYSRESVMPSFGERSFITRS